jgi:hypothetical protein
MTTHHTVELVAGTPARTRNLLARVPDAVLATILAAAITGAWLAFFTFVPLDFRVP